MKMPVAGLAVLSLVLLLAACGQRGPLVMPEPKARPPAADTRTAPANSGAQR